MNLRIERSGKRKVKEAELWNEKKKPHEGAFFKTYFHSITPHESNQGGKR